MTKTIETLEAENVRLVAALEFYRSSWVNQQDGIFPLPELLQDAGRKAGKALADNTTPYTTDVNVIENLTLYIEGNDKLILIGNVVPAATVIVDFNEVGRKIISEGGRLRIMCMPSSLKVTIPIS